MKKIMLVILVCSSALTIQATIQYSVESGLDLNWYYLTENATGYTHFWSVVGYYKDYDGDGIEDYLMGLKDKTNGNVRIMALDTSATGGVKTYSDKIAGRDITAVANTFVPLHFNLVHLYNSTNEGDLWVIGTNATDKTNASQAFTKFIFWKLNKSNTSFPTETTFEISANSELSPTVGWLGYSYDNDDYPDILIYNTLPNANNKFWVGCYSGADGSTIFSKEFDRNADDTGTSTFYVIKLSHGISGKPTGDYNGDNVPELLLNYSYYYIEMEPTPMLRCKTHVAVITKNGNFLSPYSGWELVVDLENEMIGYGCSPVGDFNKDNCTDAVFFNTFPMTDTSPVFFGYDLKNKTRLFTADNSDIGTGSELHNHFGFPAYDSSYNHIDINGDSWLDLALYQLVSSTGSEINFGMFNGYDGGGADKGRKIWFATLPDYNCAYYPSGDFDDNGLADFGLTYNPSEPGSATSGQITWDIGQAYAAASSYSVGKEFSYNLPYSFSYSSADDSFIANTNQHHTIGDIDGDGSEDYLLIFNYNCDKGDDGSMDNGAAVLYAYDNTAGTGDPPTTAEMIVTSDEDITMASFFQFAQRIDTQEWVDNNDDGSLNDGILMNLNRFLFCVSYKGTPAVPTPTPTPTATATATPTPTPIAHFTFDTDTEGWTFLGTVLPYAPPASSYEPGHLGISPQGSDYAFSYWESPDVQIVDGKVYRSTWVVDSDATDPDKTVQFRLRINQKGSWQAWNRIVNSNKSQSPPPAKSYDVILNPDVVGTDDANLVFSFDLLSFDLGDDLSSWLFLDELIVEETQILTQSEILSYDFDTDTEGWTFQGAVPPYDTPLSGTAPGEIGMSPQGSTFSFSYWASPDISITDGKQYALSWTVKSTATNPDETVQFRLRCNQKGSWQAWDHVINSMLGSAPAAGSPKEYQLFFNSVVTDTDDNVAVFSFDLMSFDWLDDVNSWLSLDSLVMEEITLSP